MSTIASVGMSPWPQSSPSTKVQPATPAKLSNVVSPENAGVRMPVAPMGELAQVQATYRPGTLPPVDPASQAADPTVLANAAVPERSGQLPPALQVGSTDGNTPRHAGVSAVSDRARPTPAEPATQRNTADARPAPSPKESAYPGQLPKPYQPPVDVAMEKQINELIPNLWKASRAAVDVLIGEKAQAAVAAREEAFNSRVSAAAELAAKESYAAQASGGGTGRNPGGQFDAAA